MENNYMVQPKIQMIGKTFGRLTVLEQTEALKKSGRPGISAAVSVGRKSQYAEPACVIDRPQG